MIFQEAHKNGNLGISTIEREFFYDIVLPDGKTVGEFMAPQIETAYKTGEMPPLLPMIN